MLAGLSRLGAVVTTMIRTNLQFRMAAIAAVLGSIAAVLPGAAQAPADAVSVDVSECVKLTSPEQRLACFEAQVESSRSAPAATSTSPPAPESSSSREKDKDRDDRDEPPPADIEARIAEIRETVPNSYVITLDNGQVWRQTVPKAYPLQPGHAVRIYYSRWRSYRLTNETLKGFIQVERAR